MLHWKMALLHKLFWSVLPRKWSDTLDYKFINLLTQANICHYLCPKDQCKTGFLY